MKEKIKTYVIAILIPLAIGGLSAFITKDSMDIYSTLNTPPLSPPSVLFPIVWTILYILMGVSSAMVYLNKDKMKTKVQSALLTYGVSLFFNFFWSILFFNMRTFLFAFIWLLVLLYLIIRTITKYRQIDKVAAYLQIPYALWVAFAGYLNFGIWYLN